MLKIKKIFFHMKNIRNVSCTQCKYSAQQYETFIGEKDRFNGITVDSAKLQCEKEIFSNKLNDIKHMKNIPLYKMVVNWMLISNNASTHKKILNSKILMYSDSPSYSLKNWFNEGKRCIWFKVHINDSSYVPILAQKGFNFHHARDDFVMMYKWLPVDSKPNLPPACHTNLGVGALVLNDKNQLLAISEKHYDYPHWKLPGGYVERGEDIVEAAQREVKEETGVKSKFISLITFRHTHNMMFGNSDIYVLLMMKALSDKITISQREVKDCMWMNIDEYTNHPHVHEFNKLVIDRALFYKDSNLRLNIQKKTVKWSQFTREMNYLIVTGYDSE